ncbi:MAG: VanZ family protein [Bacteroidaceae bacterium]|nr:VanZ family protein [Bacteroidaceae bacterium]
MKYDIGLIMKYVFEYDAGIPKSLALGFSVAVCAFVVVLSVVKADNILLVRRVSWSLLLGYVLLVLCFTVFFREGKDVAQISMKPLWNYESLNYKLIAESILNVFLFMPIGFLAGAAVRNRRMLTVLGIGLFISFSIEVMQYVFQRGVCNIDDLMHNVLGCFIGYSLFALCSLMFWKKRI